MSQERNVCQYLALFKGNYQMFHFENQTFVLCSTLVKAGVFFSMLPVFIGFNCIPRNISVKQSILLSFLILDFKIVRQDEATQGRNQSSTCFSSHIK